jgi:hypothetical protein
MKITQQEAKNWLVSEGYVRCKELHTELLFDAVLWDDDAVLLRQASHVPVDLYVVSMDVFAEKFGALGD